MKKVLLKVTIKSNDIFESLNTYGILDSDVLRYEEKDNTSVKLDLNNNILIRENKNVYMKFTFSIHNDTGNIYILKDIKKQFNVNIKTSYLEKNKNLFWLKYSVFENNNFEYIINILY